MNLQGPTFELASAARSGLRRLRLFHELEDAMMECAHLVFPAHHKKCDRYGSWHSIPRLLGLHRISTINGNCYTGDEIRSRRRQKDSDSCKIVRGTPTLSRRTR